MCKKISILCLLLFSFLSSLSAQNKISVDGSRFYIKLRDIELYKTIEQVNNNPIIDYSFSSDDSKPGSFKLPVQDIFIVIPNNTKPNIKVTSYNRVQIDANPSLNNYPVLLNDSTINSKPSSIARANSSMPFQLLEVLAYERIRDFYVAQVRINVVEYDDISKKTFEYKDIVIQTELLQGTNVKESSPLIFKCPFDEAFSKIIANSENAEQFRILDGLNSSNNSNDNWINYNADYIKIGVAKDGIYKIGKSEIEKVGFNLSSINPKSLQLFKLGIEQPITVYGEDDQSFNDQDYIEFIGSKNYSTISPRVINKEYEEYIDLMNRYTDTTFYFLTWNNKNGARVQKNKPASVFISDSLYHYDELLHLEEHPIDALFYTFNESQVRNQLPFWESSKSWYWRWLASWSPSISQTFQMTNLVSNKAASVYAKVVSFGSNQQSKPHFVKFNLNNTKIDSSYLDRFGRVLLKGTSTTLLRNGSNTFNLTYKENNGSTSGICLLDWLEVEYPRDLVLSGDSLIFSFRSELQSKLRVIKISNAVSNEYVIYRTSPSIMRIVDYKIINKNLVFSDTVGNGSAYTITVGKKLLLPEVINRKKFQNIRSKITEADYVAISNSIFQSAVQSYVNLIKNNYKIKTSIFYVNDIYDEFGFGLPTPESIKDFIKYLIANSPKPIPSYLTLIGDANYDYKGIRKKQSGVRIGENYVPSYGFPVSDNWYVINELSSTYIPQMFVGRIPINNENELTFYQSKVNSEFSQSLDEWNKRFIFFSGGSGTQAELDNLRNIQQKVIDQYIIPTPLSGIYDHFYKIKGSDFGPYSHDYINNSISNGAIFYSYLGHSGTATWDNSISDVSQLKNSRNRYFFVSDFGCSTNKFAEPDIICFGERFLLSKDGQALGYIGNSALGFTSIAYTAPNLLFESFIKDKAKSIGQIHWLTKTKMFSLIGNSETAKLFSYSNTLIGDPVLELKIPDKPNLAINNSDIIIANVNGINDSQDSVECKLLIHNYGVTNNAKYSLKIIHLLDKKPLIEKLFIKELPSKENSVIIKLGVKNLPGYHSLKIELDNKNEINELNENDNIVIYNFFVSSSQIRDLLITSLINSNLQSLTLLSPQQKPITTAKVLMRSSHEREFKNYNQQEISLDTYFTKVLLPNINKDRIWFKFGIGSNDTIWGQPKSFTNKSIAKLSINDSIGYKSLRLKKLTEKNNSITFKQDIVTIGVISAGQLAGQTCIITLNGKNLLENTFFLGVGICVFNPLTLELENSKWYELFSQPSNHNAFEAYVKSIPNGKIIALGISGDAVNNNSAQFRNVLKSIGSTKADSIQFKGSWAFIGIKGGDPNTFLEVVKGPFNGLISVSKDFTIANSSGEVSTEILGPVAKWKYISIPREISENMILSITPIGYSSPSAKGDTLSKKLLLNDKWDIENLNYPFCQFIVNMSDATNKGIGELKTIDIDYTSNAELGTNYQVVSVSKDTLDQGETVKLKFRVYNVGETTAFDFKIAVESLGKDNYKSKIFEQKVDSIALEKYKEFTLEYNSAKVTGNIQFNISIDTENKILELYEDNNFYSVPVYVKPNNKPAKLNLTIDGGDIVNGDYVSSKPNIKLELNDESLIPITDTTAVKIYLNNKLVGFKNNPFIIYSFSPSNPKFVIDYTPQLADGDYTLKVIGKNATGSTIDTAGIVRKFVVSSNSQLLNVFNYPNPFTNDTYFTFKLAQIPDELKIKIYTITGRMIKDFEVKREELKYDFNRIYWDGRDNDGDEIANGTYLYKVVIKKDLQEFETTQKISKVK